MGKHWRGREYFDVFHDDETASETASKHKRPGMYRALSLKNYLPT
ncbi:hypothetical protein PAMC26577_29600 [Caballeronia sordidicola]|uniref:Uncharacterized protein n=1 Tax=Caballeronia sordidicola TaxID=196367 RepID=A0A242MF05_CABSO|nr:hypothetical protein PAMC26577_29600 [Caballeronia sordidicola]